MPILEYRDMFQAFGHHQIPICWMGINMAYNKYFGIICRIVYVARFQSCFPHRISILWFCLLNAFEKSTVTASTACMLVMSWLYCIKFMKSIK